jgi:hypothetical protein
LSSCKSYQISTVSSPNAKKTDSTGVFNVENDSLILSYHFMGENSPLNIEVFNKLNEPLYVNWAKSALIVADKAYSYAGDEVKIQGSTSAVGTQYYRNGATFSDGSISATAKLPNTESFIPPHSKITMTTYILRNIGMDKIDKSYFKPAMLNYNDGSGQIHGKEATFSAANSPLKFKSYLTLYILKDNLPRAITFQQEFFVTSVTKSGVSPASLYQFSNHQGDVIVNAKTTGYAKTMAVIGLVGAVGALTTAEATLNEKNNHK